LHRHRHRSKNHILKTQVYLPGGLPPPQTPRLIPGVGGGNPAGISRGAWGAAAPQGKLFQAGSFFRKPRWGGFLGRVLLNIDVQTGFNLWMFGLQSPASLLTIATHVWVAEGSLAEFSARHHLVLELARGADFPGKPGKNLQPDCLQVPSTWGGGWGVGAAACGGGSSGRRGPPIWTLYSAAGRD